MTVRLASFMDIFYHFNPHHHAGGDRPRCPPAAPPFDFNPHHHAGGDGGSSLITSSFLDFNPHHHAGGDACLLSQPGLQDYFNPHHHAGGDAFSFAESYIIIISIHTTTQVVTVCIIISLLLLKISIHTTTQVVTHILSFWEGVLQFQSTPPRRW